MKKRKKTIALLVAAVLFSFGFSMIVSLSQGLPPFDMTTIVFGITILISVLSIGYLYNRILESNSTKSVVQLKKRLIPSFLFLLLATAFIALSLYYAGGFVLFKLRGWNTANFFSRIDLSAIISLSIGLLLCCIVFLYATWQQAVAREQQLREKNLKYRYRTLKTQVNPHFLFNSLNTLSEIIYEDTPRADRYIQRLAGVYRFILDHEETDLVPLREELDFVNQYFSLQSERDEHKIYLDIRVKNAEQYSIIPISLQILIENALKHNAASVEQPLRMEITNDDNYVVVSNNIQRKSILSDSSGMGLLNLQERAQLITHKEVVISGENNRFIVKLPVIKSQT